MTTPTATEKRAAYIAGLKELTAFLEERPELIPLWDTIGLDHFCDTPEELAGLARQLGNSQKFGDPEDSYIGLRRSFGPHHLDLNICRDEVCERVQVGEEEIEVPDPDAPMVKVMQPIYETRCPESFLAPAS
jgi:hypothetical protein